MPVKIIVNAAKCLNCNTLISSVYRHDWQCCPCFNKGEGHGIFVDGGFDYLRHGWHKQEEYLDFSETTGEPDEEPRRQVSEDPIEQRHGDQHVCRYCGHRGSDVPPEVRTVQG